MKHTQSLEIDGVTVSLSFECPPPAERTQHEDLPEIEGRYRNHAEVQEQAFPDIAEAMSHALLKMHHRTSGILEKMLYQQLTTAPADLAKARNPL